MEPPPNWAYTGPSEFTCTLDGAAEGLLCVTKEGLRFVSNKGGTRCLWKDVAEAETKHPLPGRPHHRLVITVKTKGTSTVKDTLHPISPSESQRCYTYTGFRHLPIVLHCIDSQRNGEEEKGEWGAVEDVLNEEPDRENQEGAAPTEEGLPQKEAEAAERLGLQSRRDAQVGRQIVRCLTLIVVAACCLSLFMSIKSFYQIRGEDQWSRAELHVPLPVLNSEWNASGEAGPGTATESTGRSAILPVSELPDWVQRSLQSSTSMLKGEARLPFALFWVSVVVGLLLGGAAVASTFL